MATEPIDIELRDRIPDSIRAKILNIAQASLEGYNNVSRLGTALEKIDKSAAAQARAAIASVKLATAQQRLAGATASAEAAQNRLQASTLSLSRAQQRAAQQANAYSESFLGFVRNVAAVAGAGLGVRALIEMGDAYTTLQNKLSTVTTSQAQVADLTERLFQLANKTRAPVEETATAFVRFDRSLQQLGKSQEDTLRLTETVNKALAVGGATTQERASALLQLSQAFNAGKLQGDEFRSVAENIPVVLDAIAKATKTPINQVKNLAKEGKITSEVLFNAFSLLANDIDAKYGKTIPTVADSLVILKNNALQAFGEFNKATGFTENLAKAILFLADNIKLVAVAASTLGATFLVAFGPQVIKAVLSVTTALAANPVGLAIIAITAAVAGLMAYKDDIKIFGDGVTTLGDAFKAAFTGVSEFVGDAVTALRNLVNDSDFSAVRKALETLTDVFKRQFDANVEIAKAAVNFIVAAFVGLGKSLGLVAANLPAAFELGWKGIANGAISAVENIINVWQTGFRGIAKILEAVSPDVAASLNKTLDSLKIEFPRVKMSAEAKEVGGEIGDIFGKAFATDYVGNAVAAIKKVGQDRRIYGSNRPGDTLRGAGKNTTVPDADKGAEKRATILQRINSELDKQLRSYGLLAEERYVQQKLDEIDIQLASKKLPLLTKPEKEALTLKLQQVEANKRVQQSQDRIYEDIKGPQKEYIAGLTATQILLDRNLISQEKAEQSVNRLTQEYARATNPLFDYAKGLEDERRLLALNADERAALAPVIQLENQLRAKGIPLTLEQVKALTEENRVLIEQQKLRSAKDQFISESSVQQTKDFIVQLTAIKQLLADVNAGFTKNDAVNSLLQGPLGQYLDGTTDAINAQLSKFQDYYARIDELRQADVISEDAARGARAKIFADSQKVQLSQASTFFTALEALSTSKNKKLAAIGKAAAISNTIIKTYESATSAYASLAGIPYVGPALGAAAAAAAIAAGLANVQQIRAQGTGQGYMAGGYTGDGAISAVAGVVHGQEFVTNAAATARNRPVLEAMNRGATVGSVGTPNIVIEDHTSGGVTFTATPSLTMSEVRLIAKDTVLKEAPTVIAQDLTSPNSKTSKAMRDTHKVERRR